MLFCLSNKNELQSAKDKQSFGSADIMLILMHTLVTNILGTYSRGECSYKMPRCNLELTNVKASVAVFITAK